MLPVQERMVLWAKVPSRCVEEAQDYLRFAHRKLEKLTEETREERGALPAENFDLRIRLN